MSSTLSNVTIEWDWEDREVLVFGPNGSLVLMQGILLDTDEIERADNLTKTRVWTLCDDGPGAWSLQRGLATVNKFCYVLATYINADYITANIEVIVSIPDAEEVALG